MRACIAQAEFKHVLSDLIFMLRTNEDMAFLILESLGPHWIAHRGDGAWCASMPAGPASSYGTFVYQVSSVLNVACLKLVCRDSFNEAGSRGMVTANAAF